MGNKGRSIDLQKGREVGRKAEEQKLFGVRPLSELPCQRLLKASPLSFLFLQTRFQLGGMYI